METSPQSKSLFNYYNFYKVIIGILLLGMSVSQQAFIQQFRLPELFQTLTLNYLLLNAGLLVLFRFTIKAKPNHIFFSLALDIFLLHGLFYCGTGISGGLANLIIISVAAGNIIIRGRIGLSFAALATLLTILIEGERFLSGLNDIADTAKVGIIGSMYFASAYILQYLSVRISQNESLLKQQEKDLLKLEKLNHQIIQSMRTGIIVCDEQENVKLINQACQDLIGLSQKEKLPTLIADRIALWKKAPDIRTTPFKVNQDNPLVQANFSRLQNETGTEILIFIDDTRKMTQQAQQLKLASLGRLTASIAHEVRNPLGAISHATQLLAESENLDNADRKMTDIIQRHSIRVNQIIENTLQLSRRSEPEISDIDLKLWLEKIISEYTLQQNQAYKINLIVNNDDITARFDPSQIEQVLINLVDNGIRHGTQENPSSQLFILLDQSEVQGQAYISVIDQGAGVSPENALHLFEPFFTTESQGTGLGLYLSREICEANQAHLDYIDPEDTRFQTSQISELSDQRVGACFKIIFAHAKRII
jgi:two-component system sensor histidine kinase PilS (NtrC family)